MKDFGGTTLLALGVALVVALLTLIPFILMLLLGALGHAFHEPHLYVSFWQSILLVFLVSFIGAFFGGGRK